MDAVEELRKITVGRITYCEIATLPLLIFLHLVFDPGQTKDERFRDFILSFVLVFLNVPIVLVGIGVLLRQRQQHNPLRFWAIVVTVSAIPLLFIIVSVVLEGVAGVHIRPFT